MHIRNLLVLFRHLTVKSIEKGEILIQEGTTTKDIFFIKKGLIRSYFLNDKADDVTFQLYPEYHIFGNVHSIFFNKPSRYSYEAIECTKIYTISYDSFQKLLAKNPRLIELNSIYLAKIIINQAFQRLESFVLLSPEERYIKYMEDYPGVMNRAPDKYIANVLGITPVSLSRIKNRILLKKD